MSVSVNITLEVLPSDVSPSNPDLKLHIRSNGMIGVAYTDWAAFVKGAEITGLISAPSGPGLTPCKKRMRQASMKQEAESAERLGGRRQTGSGSLVGNKGDGQVLDQQTINELQGAPGRFRIENKYSTSTQITLRLSDLTKIRAECAGQETPVFDVQFKEKGTLRTVDNWVLVPRREWEQLANTDHDS